MSSLASSMTNIVDFPNLKKENSEMTRRLGAAVNRINNSITDLERYEDLEGIKSMIQSLASLRQQFAEKLEQLS